MSVMGQQRKSATTILMSVKPPKAEVRRAVAKGYQRSFCLKSELGRGSPDKPGLMAALDIGGECHGLAFRIDCSRIDAETRVIWSREMIIHAYYPDS